MSEPSTSTPLRPRDLALMLLASGDLRPRQRARDQQADVAGLTLKRIILDRLAALDPEPSQIESSLEQIVQERGAPHGPARAVAAGIRDEWQAACTSPAWLTQLLDAATRASQKDKP